MTTAKLTADQLTFLSSSFACAIGDVTHLAGDGSSRQYYRITKPHGDHDSLVVMKLAGEDHEQLRAGQYPFIATHQVLKDGGFAVPAIVATDAATGLIILEDYGDTTLWDELRGRGSKDKIAAYRRCFKPLTGFLALKGTPQDRWQQWRFDVEKLSFEFDFFIHHYVGAAHAIKPRKPAALNAERDKLCQALAADSLYFCHRDFHSKNIMVLKESQAAGYGIIDFQDARLGPASYDAVSLFFDPYVDLNLAERHQLYSEFCESLPSDHPAVNSLKSLKELMILQRLTKALGSFGYLTLDRKRGDYLCHEGPALGILLSLKELPSEYPEIMAILGAIDAKSPEQTAL